MSTLCDAGRIRIEEVDDEIERLKKSWHSTCTNDHISQLKTVLNSDEIDKIDLFDQAQLATVITVCKLENSMSAAGRKLYAKTREKKKVANDADRLSKYLQRFGLNWSDVNT